jgi:hypothetical protein
MSNTNTGGPAFPLQSIGPDFAPGYAGMTLRDYFAAKAMQGLMGRNWSSHTGTDQELIDLWARSAYGMADAMLKARTA